jgi:hypothetical protein|nr:MAG TPA: hypothetical protein [Caudoviricetes sp.]
MNKKLNTKKEYNRLKDIIDKIDLSNPYQTVFSLSKAIVKIKKISVLIGRREDFKSYLFTRYTEITMSILQDKLISSGIVMYQMETKEGKPRTGIGAKGTYAGKILKYIKNHWREMNAEQIEEIQRQAFSILEDINQNYNR